MNPNAAPETAASVWCVYLVCCRDGSLYCGITNNPVWRWAQHRTGQGAAYTRIKGVQQMRVIICCLSRSEALKREYAVKQLKRSAKLALWENGQPVNSKAA